MTGHQLASEMELIDDLSQATATEKEIHQRAIQVCKIDRSVGRMPPDKIVEYGGGNVLISTI
jgi:hypothetical protein